MSEAPRAGVVVRRVRIRAERRKTVTIAGDVVRVPCARCGRDVVALTWEETASLLRCALERVDDLLEDGRVHGIVAVTGARWICRDSLFERRPA